MRLLTMPVFLAFLSMGFADAVGPFVGPAKNEFQLSNLAASLIPFVGFSMFGLLSTLGLPDAVAGAPLYHLDRGAQLQMRRSLNACPTTPATQEL